VVCRHVVLWVFAAPPLYCLSNKDGLLLSIKFRDLFETIMSQENASEQVSVAKDVAFMCRGCHWNPPVHCVTMRR
jgi:hypothetical protein